MTILFYRLHDRINEDTVIFGERAFIDEDVLEKAGSRFSELKLNDLASEAGSVLYSNTVLFGFISGLLDLDTKAGEAPIRKNSNQNPKKLLKATSTLFTKAINLEKHMSEKSLLKKRIS